MPYIGKNPLTGNYSKLDDFSGDFDGSDATHALASNGVAITPNNPQSLIISINGVIQESTTDYTVSGTNITFTTAPTAGDNFFGVAMGEKLDIGTPSDATVTSAKLTGNLVTPGTLDMNGQELILDADADTSITADTDDTIDIKIAGADDFQITANTMSVLSGSTLNIDSGATIANSGTATGFGLTGVTTGSGNVTITSGNLIVASGNGIDFSASGDSGGSVTSELLDEYEEGTWTPTLITYSGTAPTVTYTTQTGHYIRIGRMINLFAEVATSSYTGGSSPTYILIGNLPYSIGSNTPAAPGAVDWSQVELDDSWGANVADHVCTRLWNTPDGMLLALSASGSSGNYITWADWPSGSGATFRTSMTYMHL